MNHGRYDRGITRHLFLAVILLLYPESYAFCQDADLIPVPLYINSAYAGEISVKILEDESVQVRPSEMIAYLEELMSEEAIDTAKMIFPETGWLNLTEMGGLGVRILFRFEDLTISISIPAHLRRETTVSLKGERKDPEGEYIEQSNFSAFLNIELWNKFVYETLTYSFSATPEIGLNIFDWVIEAKGGIQTTGDLFFWDYARLIKDFPSIGYRLEAGDLTIPVTDLTGVSRLLGASFRKNYKLSPDSGGPTANEKEIFLREPSRVEIYMNDRKIREKEYQSGNYIFRDFPLARGINKISIRWEDSEGLHEENLFIPFENSLLTAGEFDLGVAAGIPDREILLPSVTGYQYIGITDNFTFGITESFNIDSLELVLRPDLLLSTGFGNFNLVPKWGINFNGGQKVEAGLDYQMINPGRDNYLNFGAGVDYKYNAITAAETPLSHLSFDGYYNLIFGDGFSLTPTVSWGWRFDENRQIIRAKAAFKKSIRGGSAVSANLGLTYDKELTFTATISYSSSFPDADQNIYLLSNLETQKLTAFWNKYKTGDSNLAFNANAELPINLEEKFALGLNSEYQNPYFDLSGGHDFDAVIETGEIHNATQLEAAAGMVYADGYFMFSRPVRDSFVIIAPGDEFTGQLLRVNPTSGGSELELTGKAGVMSGVSSFRTQKVYIEPDELPEGMDDAGMKYLVRPSYKSAVVVKPQADILIFIGGTVKDSDGAPVETVLGRLTGKTGGESVDFFTDENGYFEAYSLAPDIYTMELIGFDVTAEIDLTDIESGFHDAGIIELKEE